MSSLEYVTEDANGYFIDFSLKAMGNEIQKVKMESIPGVTMKIIFGDDEYYCLNFLIKNLSVNISASTLSKKINKINDGSAIKIALFCDRKTWFVTEKGLMIAYEIINSLSLPL